MNYKNLPGSKYGYGIKFIAIALAYFVSGRLGLLLAIPPGYATAIWPPSGVALAALLLYGYGFWSAVWIGSFFLNLQVYFNGSVIQSFSYFFINAFCIASGATLQAGVGALFVRHFVNIPTTLERIKDIAGVMLLGGPIACVIAASIGATTLLMHNAIPWEDYPLTWFTWWVGDSIGVLIFTPLLLLLLQFNQVQISGKRKIYVVVPVTVLFLITIYVFTTVNNWELEKQKFYFEKQAENFVAQLQNKIKDYIDVLYSIERFYNASDYVSRSEFKEFTQYTFERFKGIKALEWAPRVPEKERDQYIHNARHDGFRNFQFRQINEAGEVAKAPTRPEYFPVYYLEPYQGNEWALGYDLSSEATRLQSIKYATDRASTTATSPLILLQDLHDSTPGILIYKPVYQGKEKTTTIEERRQKLEGFIVGVFNIAAIIDPIYDNIDKQGLRLQIYDISNGQNKLIYRSFSGQKLRNKDYFFWQKSFDVAGRIWKIDFRKNEEYFVRNKSWQTWLVLTISLLITAISGLLMLIITGQSDIVQKLVEEKTAELNFAQEKSQLFKNIAIEAASATSVNEILQMILDSICDYIKWPVGHAFLLGEDKQSMISSRIWHFESEPKKYADLKNISEESSFAEGVCLPGMVLKDKKPIYVENVLLNNPFPRKNCFAKMNFHTAFAVPILIQNQVVAMVEFFSPHTIKKDAQMTDFIETVCIQLGRVIERKEIDNIKNEFVAIVSHELRTPLTSIRGALGLITGGVAGELPKKASDLIAIANQNSQRLNDIIDDILDIGKIESGKMEIKLTAIEIAAFLQQAIVANQAYGDKYQVKFELVAVPQNTRIIADETRLMQVMANLLSNAAKFSPPGSVVKIKAVKEDENILQISVRDFGNGIPEDFRSRIFEKFSQAENVNTKNREGTGLGLVITRKLIEAMGGKINFESKVGKGTTFFFTVSLASPD